MLIIVGCGQNLPCLICCLHFGFNKGGTRIHFLMSYILTLFGMCCVFFTKRLPNTTVLILLFALPARSLKENLGLHLLVRESSLRKSAPSNHSESLVGTLGYRNSARAS